MTAARVLPVLGILPLAVLMFACERPTSVHVSSTDVTGQWAITADNVSGQGLSCSVTGLNVVLAQHDDGTFTGTALGGTVICNYFGTETAQAVDSGTATNGTVNVADRTIAIDAFGVGTLNGTVSPTNATMGGTTSLMITVGGGATLTITGPWSGAKVF
jgi:hypothetical protein